MPAQNIILAEFCSKIPIANGQTTLLQLMDVSSEPHFVFKTTFRQWFSLPIDTYREHIYNHDGEVAPSIARHAVPTPTIHTKCDTITIRSDDGSHGEGCITHDTSYANLAEDTSHNGNVDHTGLSTPSKTDCLLSAIDVILGHQERTIIIPTPVILEEEDMVIVTNDNSSTNEHVHADREISLIGPLMDACATYRNQISAAKDQCKQLQAVISKIVAINIVEDTAQCEGCTGVLQYPYMSPDANPAWMSIHQPPDVDPPASISEKRKSIEESKRTSCPQYCITRFDSLATG
ncbi:hypothetical protein BD769DRAFT_1388289 [Suillus cothurnatus]|nr:hypothetical protein BD769DRAFT_1388289 [Suillus cothurnatus]